jgi:peptide/nickel transport system substrate-binding protein
LLREGRAIVDFDKRKQIYWTLQEILNNDGGYLVPMFADDLFAHLATLKGVPHDSEGELRIAERMWFES